MWGGGGISLLQSNFVPACYHPVNYETGLWGTLKKAAIGSDLPWHAVDAPCYVRSPDVGELLGSVQCG